MLTISPGRRRFMFQSGWWAILSSPTAALPFDPSKPVDRGTPIAELLHRKARKEKRTLIIDIPKLSSETPHTKRQSYIHLVTRPHRATPFSRGAILTFSKEMKRNISSVREKKKKRNKTLVFRRNEENQDTRNGCE